MNNKLKSQAFPKHVAKFYSEMSFASTDNMNINGVRDRCGGSSMSLDIYQRFVAEYLTWTRPPNVHGLLLFHNTGAGKTCTSIHVIEEYLKMYTNPIVYVLLPLMKDVDAYKESLIKKCPKNFVVNVTESQGYTQCNVTGDKRIILLDFKTYARARVRETIKVPGINVRQNPFLSTLVIVDEADTLLKCESLNHKTPDDFVFPPQGRHKKLSATETVLFDAMQISERINNNSRDMTVPLFGLNKSSNYQVTLRSNQLLNYNDKRSKELHEPQRLVVLMTGTPYVNDPHDILYLLKCIKPSADNFGLFEGTISYVDNRKDYTLFPRVFLESLPIVLTPQLEQKIRSYVNTHKLNTLEKQTTIECSGPSCKRELKHVLPEEVPKLTELVKRIQASPVNYKHLIYVHEKSGGSRVIEHVLKQMFPQWVNLIKSIHTNDKNSSSILNKYNKDSNKTGAIIKILIIQGKGFVRASTFKAVRALHIMNPLVDPNEHNQLMGRVARRCSHDQLKDMQERTVTVVLYYVDTPNRRSANERVILLKLQKQQLIDEMIEYSKNVAVDKHITFNFKRKHLLNM